MKYKCLSKLNVVFVDYRSCSDFCCDIPIDEDYEFEVGTVYEIGDKDLSCRLGRCGVYLFSE
jgi:uncharacterized Zn finger protein